MQPERVECDHLGGARRRRGLALQRPHMAPPLTAAAACTTAVAPAAAALALAAAAALALAAAAALGHAALGLWLRQHGAQAEQCRLQTWLGLALGIGLG